METDAVNKALHCVGLPEWWKNSTTPNQWLLKEACLSWSYYYCHYWCYYSFTGFIIMLESYAGPHLVCYETCHSPKDMNNSEVRQASPAVELNDHSLHRPCSSRPAIGQTSACCCVVVSGIRLTGIPMKYEVLGFPIVCTTRVKLRILKILDQREKTARTSRWLHNGHSTLH
jgi:hypothetical protein